MKKKKIKFVEVEYLESGSFQGGEEDVFNAGIERGEECIVLSKETFEELKEKAWRYDELG